MNGGMGVLVIHHTIWRWSLEVKPDRCFFAKFHPRHWWPLVWKLQGLGYPHYRYADIFTHIYIYIYMYIYICIYTNPAGWWSQSHGSTSDDFHLTSQMSRSLIPEPTVLFVKPRAKLLRRPWWNLGGIPEFQFQFSILVNKRHRECLKLQSF